MSKILPYVSELEYQKRAYIKPNGEILFTTGKHKVWAKDFCLGSDCTDFRNIFTSEKEFLPNIISSSQLTIEQLELLKFWLQGKENFDENIFSDFLVYVLRQDKTETKSRKVICTTSSIPHIRFWNYDLMGWRIERHTPEIFDRASGLFIPCHEEGIISTHQDRNAEEELEELKKNVLLKDRHYFLK